VKALATQDQRAAERRTLVDELSRGQDIQNMNIRPMS
jgi:hypothetical protein